MNRLRRFFTNSEGQFSLVALLPVFIVALFFIIFMVVAPPVWEYTNSPSFCGTACHTMPPEYSTYQVSPHSRVLCVDCHIGRDLLIVQAIRKSGHMRLLIDTLTENYEYPIRAAEMSPARETCEVCHSPEKFSSDSLRVINTFEDNRSNDPYSIYLLMHTGGGSQREGLGFGIHWHIENEITFISTDDRQQEIPWVRVETPDGDVVEYSSINSPIDTANLDQYEIHEMDCITCHNRIAHNLKTPGDSVDEALHRGDISTDIPFIRARGVELLSEKYHSIEAANQSIETLEQYYSDYYPEFYNEGGAELVDEAIAQLKVLYTDSNYPDQELSFDTHPNNTGHRESPGCFRCHDGQHFSDAGEVIRLECNLCHSIPQVVRPDEIEPMLPLATGIEPGSHLDSTWISRHHLEFDASCTNCHTTTNPGGTDDQSFCANSGCHGITWEYAGFDAPGLAAMLGVYQVEAPPLLEDFEGTPTYAVLQPLFTQECGGCHGPVPSNNLRLTDYESLLAGGNSGPAIMPGEAAENSKMWQVLTEGHFATLTDHQMELLKTWIESGAPVE